ITLDGWFKRGDIAAHDSEGFYAIADCKKELIKYRGWQGMLSLFSQLNSALFPPVELKALLISHPDIMDSGVIGIFSESQVTELPSFYHASKQDTKSLNFISL
ncbi:hypothetical protein BS47DRAFT_1310028, partial [Hydnum rufescens UP504]